VPATPQTQQSHHARDGLAGIHVIDLTTENRFGVNDDLPFTVASSIKVPLLVSLYRKARSGELDVAAPFTVDKRRHAGGSGVPQFFDHPATLAIEDMATPMINVSDNIATNTLIDLGGMDYVNQQMEHPMAAGSTCRRFWLMTTSARAARHAQQVCTS